MQGKWIIFFFIFLLFEVEKRICIIYMHVLMKGKIWLVMGTLKNKEEEKLNWCHAENNQQRAS